jgi:hypothetical protein
MYEYMVVNNGGIANKPAELGVWLNEQSAQGWEFFTIAGPMFFFRKPKAGQVIKKTA